MRQKLIGDGTGQMYTLEGFMASTIMILALILSVQATSITPLTSSAANQHVEAQLQFIGQDMLTSLDYSSGSTPSPLVHDILNWNGSQHVWNGSHYVKTYDKTEIFDNNLTDKLKFTLVSSGIAHNVHIIFLNNATNELVTKRMIYNGDPSDNAIIVSHKVVLHYNDVSTDFYSLTGIGDVDSSTDIYNLVDVRLTLWRM